MNYFTFPSLDRPNAVGYKVDRAAKYSSFRNGVCGWATFYETYGDGSVQHSAEVPFAKEMLPDFLSSLAHAIASAKPHDQEEMLALLADVWPQKDNLPRSRIRFALSVKYKDGKTQYYSMEECKVSAADSKRHDKRWHAVLAWHDGKIPSAYAILAEYCPRGNLIDNIHDLQQVCDVFADDNDGYCPTNVWDHFSIPNSHWGTRTPWRIVEDMIDAFRMKSWAEAAIASHVENAARRKEREADAKEVA